MTSRRIMVLALVAVLGSAYFIFFKDRDDFTLIFAISLIILMIAYVFQYQIDQIMTRGTPQKLPGAMRAMLQATSPFFHHLHPAQQQMIEDRMKRWIMKKEFISQNKQDPPEDVRYIMAYYAIVLTMHQKEFLYDGLDRIVFYHHPFLTPHYQDEVHIVEVEDKDGTIIISVPHLIKGHLEKGYYNLALHANAEAFRRLYHKEPIPWPEDIWDRLEQISGISRQTIEDYIGMPMHDPWPAAVHHQLMYASANIPEVISIFPQLRKESDAVEID